MVPVPISPAAPLVGGGDVRGYSIEIVHGNVDFKLYEAPIDDATYVATVIIPIATHVSATILDEACTLVGVVDPRW